MINIAIYQCNKIPNQNSSDSKALYLGVAALYLKTYIDIHRPDFAQNLTWNTPIQVAMSDQDLIDYCWSNNITVLGISMFVWNYDYLAAQMQRIRSLLPPHTVIVAGGGSVIPHSDQNFLQKHSWMDYAVYGSGEVAFADILQSMVDHRPLIKFNTSNMAWHDSRRNTTMLADYQYVPEPKISPYLNCEDLLTAMIEQEQQQGYDIELPYQLTRGCPYKCTFCDWNNGPVNKTTRRHGSYRDEIDLFHRLGIKRLDLSDANTGQYAEDVDLFKYLAKKNLEHDAGFTLNINLSKLKKDVNLELLTIAGESGLIDDSGFTLAVQDIHQEILANIDRPDVSWTVHKQMIHQLQERFPHLPVNVQLIQGLPGQTVENWLDTLCAVVSAGAQPWIYINELLPLAPASTDPRYTRFSVQYSSSNRYSGFYFFRNRFPQSCMSYNQNDFVTMTVWSHLFTAAAYFQSGTGVAVDLDKFVDTVSGSEHYEIMQQDLLQNWIHNDQFWFRQAFGGIEVANQVLSACTFDSTLTPWLGNPYITKMLIACTRDLKQHWSRVYKYCKDNAISSSAIFQDKAMTC